ncbi:hypothetical protein EU805_00820 [Salipiger sp. IMCC34102]|uniref:hypothetical protein n=1 Tax=Salipiger sp. IMCC34102 TaxID=2510647 RepID=UPI00101C734D|nr:hypothetical protein [Salipiger sp. IMCC34102]RYH03946.1 hypothetical protein EU805_00820 [Salipiger sp. IMCC34102]
MAQMTKAPLWFSVTIMGGLLWNVFGVIQFLGGVGRTRDDYVAQGMPSPQAEAMATYPAWIDAAFALGVLAGTVGCILVLMRKPLCVPVLAASLAGFVAMMAGNAAVGLFEVMGPQRFWTIAFTVAVAAVLLMLALYARQRRIIV